MEDSAEEIASNKATNASGDKINLEGNPIPSNSKELGIITVVSGSLGSPVHFSFIDWFL